MKLRNVVEAFNDKVSLARRYGKKVGRRLQDQVEDRPFTTLLAAFGIGYILSKIMGRRRSA
jgi:hypothetical protein